MFRLVIEPEARDDLLRMKNAGGRDTVFARRIVAIIQEIKDSQKLLSELVTDGYGTDDFDIKSYKEFWNDGLDLWRLKVFDFIERLEEWRSVPYRIIYAYDMSCSTFRILGVIHRSIAYDSDHEQTKRICQSYYELGLPRHKVTHFRASGRRKPH